MIVTINVTQEHIDNGQPRHCSQCPIALAFHDAGFKNARLNNTLVENWKDGVILGLASLPTEATKFIIRFDANAKVFRASISGTTPINPFSFDIEWRPVPPHYPSF